MMMNRLRASFLTATVITIAATMSPGLNCFASFAHQKPEASAPTGFALEIIYDKGAPPAYQSVSGPEVKGKGGWFGRFGRTPSVPTGAHSLPVRAVNIASRIEGETAVRVDVSVFLGEQFHDKEEAVASYLVRESEKISVAKLIRFGVEPFEIKVVRVAPLVTNLPSVISKSKSIVVLGIEPNNTTLPSYTVSLHNSSEQNVIALEVLVTVDGHRRVSGRPQAEEGRVLIESGATYESRVIGARDARPTPGGYAPDMPSKQEVVISTAVFADGTYEGDAEPAAQIKALTIGRKIQLVKVVALLQNASSEFKSNTAQAEERLMAQLNLLSTDVEMSVVDKLLKDFPALGGNSKANLQSGLQVALHSIKKIVRDELAEHERTHTPATSQDDCRAWVVAAQERYGAWLSRL